ncbi:MAG TPA: threonine synthase [Candidatus Caldiarchaeum subterraneum]|uniref:Threonine synthase n=1 Tax=Caldiarchaeum subterraneum TaxID=311458 RepID=A0A833ED72_CALS0|nr:threonine synthase [Aigarchaeota archaeon]HIQ30530.1 threonine synthase [Candidatus Caldarchaeum subterraneum]
MIPEATLSCIGCGNKIEHDRVVYSCPRCGDLLEVKLENLSSVDASLLKERWRSRPIGVWRYRELIPLRGERYITLHEGGTPLYRCGKLARWAGVKELYVKFEGANPTGSFKDRGMCVGITKALESGRQAVICASTGNTSSSMSAYAAAAGMKSIVLIPRGRIALGKLFQTLLYGARTIAVKGSFDDALNMVMQLRDSKDLYILNSINPWRIEGQKTLAYELYDQLGMGDYVVSVPVGNCGNISAIWKGFSELIELGLLNGSPTMLGVQAEGASPFADMILKGHETLKPLEEPRTIATAIRIGKPANWKKALRAVRDSGGTVAKVSDWEIVEAQRALASLEGIGVEPASAASLAGVKKLVEEGRLDRDSTVVCISTGTALKDPNEELLRGIEFSEVEPNVDSAKPLIEEILKP